MANPYQESLQHYGLSEFNPDWGAIQRGIEKESLRVSPQGHISQKTHPLALGSTLTNPYITTDFSESLLEFITPAYSSIDECLGVLENIHRFTIQNLEDEEMLWVASMPCPLSTEQEIPIAQYGDSNIGKLKTLYRSGLSNRYGSLMQAIAGLHYNFSMPESFWQPYQLHCGHEGGLQEFKTEQYLHLIRNFHRYSWLLIYLFGASPAACKCFVQGREHSLQELDDHSLYLPNATCLRMGNLGYKSEAQKSLFVCYNEIDSYIECLDIAMKTSYAEYEEIGQARDGEFLQINTKLLQLENEFYSTVRPKRNVESGERPLEALAKNGIEYVEVRALDLNPYLPLGIDAKQIRFLDTFLLHCLMAESTECHRQEFCEIGNNLAAVVENGRDENLMIHRDGEKILMKQWADKIITDMGNAAIILDEVHGENSYKESLSHQAAKVANPDLTPAGMMLKEMREENLSFFEFSMKHSEIHKNHFLNGSLDVEIRQMMEETALISIDKQREIEAADDVDFPTFLEQWNNS